MEKIVVTSPQTLLFSHPLLLDHGIFGPATSGQHRTQHPENPSRLATILSELNASPFRYQLELNFERLATRDELISLHTAAYVDHVMSLAGRDAEIDHETPLSAGSVHAACLAAGLGLEMVERVIRAERPGLNGFVLVRPPGHHARPEEGMGFCVFNNIAIAAHRALSLGVKRILILDWDVHHGNGTQDAFYEDDRVLFVDLHQENLFPQDSGNREEQGKGKGVGYTVNLPLPHSCRDADYLYVIEKLVKPLAMDFQPELILVSAGFDAHENDPHGSMRVTTSGYGLLTQMIKSLANQVCEGRLVLFLEGGYQPLCLAQDVVQCVAVLSGNVTPRDSFSQDFSQVSSQMVSKDSSKDSWVRDEVIDLVERQLSGWRERK